MSTNYTPQHAAKRAETPELEAWPNQYADRDYEIVVDLPEFTCHCPKTGQPDFATIKISYSPDQTCVELKSLKLYAQAFREVGIFHENVVNQIHDDIRQAIQPRRLEVIAIFNPRGGITTTVRVESKLR